MMPNDFLIDASAEEPQGKLQSLPAKAGEARKSSYFFVP
jgi:hypothetical protein